MTLATHMTLNNYLNTIVIQPQKVESGHLELMSLQTLI